MHCECLPLFGEAAQLQYVWLCRAHFGRLLRQCLVCWLPHWHYRLQLGGACTIWFDQFRCISVEFGSMSGRIRSMVFKLLARIRPNLSEIWQSGPEFDLDSMR